MSKLLSRMLILRLNCRTSCKFSSNVSNSNVKSSDICMKLKHDIIGQPDKQSNLRPICIYVPPGESQLQQQCREFRMETQEWNQKFWSEHNQKFSRERERFIAANKTKEEPSLNADQMSVFYKDFLDSNWKNHLNYNIEWYKRNIQILGMALRVHMDNTWTNIKIGTKH